MPRKSTPPPEKSDDIYEVRKIHKFRIHNGVEQFFVEWDGYPIAEATWEPVTNFVNPSPDIFARMEELRAKNSKHPGNSTRRTQSQDKRRSVAPVSPSATEVGNAPGKRKQRSSSLAAVVEPTSKRPSRASSGRGSSVVSQSTSSRQAAELPFSPPRSTNRGPAAATAQEASSRPKVADTVKSARSRSEDDSTGADLGHSDMEPQRRCEPEEIRVKSIRQDTTHGLVGVILISGVVESGDGVETRELRLPMTEVKRQFPSQLIDFLLQRIQFRPDFSKSLGTSNTTAASTSAGGIASSTPRMSSSR